MAEVPGVVQFHYCKHNWLKGVPAIFRRISRESVADEIILRTKWNEYSSIYIEHSS